MGSKAALGARAVERGGGNPFARLFLTRIFLSFGTIDHYDECLLEANVARLRQIMVIATLG